MKLSEVGEILQALADGIDPITRQSLPATGPFHHPQVLDALDSALLVVQRARRGCWDNGQPVLEGVKQRPANSYLPWGSDEESHLIADFEADVSLEALAQKHERTGGRSGLASFGWES